MATAQPKKAKIKVNNGFVAKCLSMRIPINVIINIVATNCQPKFR